MHLEYFELTKSTQEGEEYVTDESEIGDNNSLINIGTLNKNRTQEANQVREVLHK